MWNAERRAGKGLSFAVGELGSIAASPVTLQMQEKIWGRQCKHCLLQHEPRCSRDGRSGEGAEVAPNSFWQSQQKLIFLCQRKVAPLAAGEPSVTSACVYALRRVQERIKERSVLC